MSVMAIFRQQLRRWAAQRTQELQQVMETDPDKLLSVMNKANDAILARIRHLTACDSEIILLNDALHGLRLLRREYERTSKEYWELRSRKVG